MQDLTLLRADLSTTGRVIGISAPTQAQSKCTHDSRTLIGKGKKKTHRNIGKHPRWLWAGVQGKEEKR